MDSNRPWLRGGRGRGVGSGGIGGGGWRERGTDSDIQTLPIRRTAATGHKMRGLARPIWDDTVHDLASMRLSPGELARKLASRQSSNLVVARAQLLEQSRGVGHRGINLPPSLAARLQAARTQSVESIIAQSHATLVASQQLRQIDEGDIIRTQASRTQHSPRSPRRYGADSNMQPIPENDLELGNNLTSSEANAVGAGSTVSPAGSAKNSPAHSLRSRSPQITVSFEGKEQTAVHDGDEDDHCAITASDGTNSENPRSKYCSDAASSTPRSSRHSDNILQKTDSEESKESRDDSGGTSSSSQHEGSSDAKESPAHKVPLGPGSPAAQRAKERKVAAERAAQAQATRTSLDHTIQMVVHTCEELWVQLEEERVTREELQKQLQQQGNVITTLTTELLQIQDQQEAILQEVSEARASGLWGSYPTEELDPILSRMEHMSHRTYNIMTRSAPAGLTAYVPQVVPAATSYFPHRQITAIPPHLQQQHSFPPQHPIYQSPASVPMQRSILRATRTLHTQPQRQSPPRKTSASANSIAAKIRECLTTNDSPNNTMHLTNMATAKIGTANMDSSNLATGKIGIANMATTSIVTAAEGTMSTGASLNMASISSSLPSSTINEDKPLNFDKNIEVIKTRKALIGNNTSEGHDRINNEEQLAGNSSLSELLEHQRK